MKIVSMLGSLLALAMATSNLQAEKSSVSDARSDEMAGFVVKKESESRATERFFAPIRSRAELEEYLKSRKDTPFKVLSRRSFDLFISNLVFTDGGLSSYRYTELETELTPRDAYAILSLFGAQKTISYLKFLRVTSAEHEAVTQSLPVVMDDYKGYRCHPPATCIPAHEQICIGSNCGMWHPQ